MKPQINDRGRVKVRFMEIDVEGGSSAILEGLRTVTAAFSKDAVKTINGAAQARVIAPTVQAKPLAQKNGELFESVSAGEAEIEEVEEPLVAEAVDAVNAPKPKAKRTYPNCELIKDLDVETGSPNLREFAQAKTPKGTNERYLVCASWLKKVKGIKSLTYSHFYSCFIPLGWKMPKDAGHPLRNMKNKQFVQNSPSEWELHSNGEQVVSRLPQRE